MCCSKEWLKSEMPFQKINSKTMKDKEMGLILNKMRNLKSFIHMLSNEYVF